MASKSITSFLKSPSAVAHACDWGKLMGKAVLNLSISTDRIDLALASHPETEEPVHRLPSIPVKYAILDNKKTLRPEVGEELAAVLRTHNVCGMVVEWPVQADGWVGKQAGRVLHTLDQLATNKKVVNDNRPICLWNEDRTLFNEDEFGRSALYSRSTDKTVHVASEEQYKGSKSAPEAVWEDFCSANFPETFQKVLPKQNSNHSSSGAYSLLGEPNSGKMFASM